MNTEYQKRPNILFILSDDQGPWAMGCAGNREIRTPNLDRLAATGTRLDNFFCTSPVCSPARASLLTGRIPSQHGVHDWLAVGDTIKKYEPAGNGELIEYLKGMPGYTDYLAAAGYECALSGKWHLGDSHHPQKGFTFWKAHAKGGSNYYNAPMVKGDDVYEEPSYLTDVITENALSFLENRENNTEEAPFYLSVHYTAPHSPWNRENHPSELFDDYFNNCPFESVPDGLNAPEWAETLRIPCNDAEQRREFLSGYYAATTAMDKNIGRLIDFLEENNLREETLIVFTSDNGMNMGHHGIFGKGNATFPMNMYEESVKVPFIASQPGSIPQGALRSELCSQYDFMPTLLEYAGITAEIYSKLPGRSFASALRGKSCGDSEWIVVFDEYGPVRMIRNKDWKYIHRYPYGPHELYNLKEDPSESTNLIDDQEHQDTAKNLRNELRQWFTRYADPKLDGALEGVTGVGQMGRAGATGDGRVNYGK